MQVERGGRQEGLAPRPRGRQIRRSFSSETPMRCFTLVAASLLWAGPLFAQRNSTVLPAEWDAYTRAFDGFAAEDSVVGAGTLYLSGGRIEAHHQYGWGDRGRRGGGGGQTNFHW